MPSLCVLFLPTDLLAARVTNTNRTYDAYVTAMISNTTGSIESRRYWASTR